MIKRAWRYFGVRMFLSYLFVISVGILVLTVAAYFTIPISFNRNMGDMMTGGEMMNGGEEMMEAEENDALFNSFSIAVRDSLRIASIALFVVATGVSVWVSRQVVAPVTAMTRVSARIADGHYEERVAIPGDPDAGDELTELALSFNRMAEKLFQTENMRRQLLGDVTHELRTPLTTIKGSVEGLLDGVLPQSPETYQEIYREADRLQRLVADLQKLSRIEAGASPLDFHPLNLLPLIESVANRLRPQFEEKGVALRVDLPPDALLVNGDADRLTQVLVNLVGNALQYTPAGGGVTVAAQQDGDVVRVDVRDTGMGIDAEHLGHVFDRFYRVDKSRSRAGGGSGIGLTISRHLVQAHGGEVFARSEGLGYGSTFGFALPGY